MNTVQNRSNQPAPPIPPPLRGVETGTFAHRTITVRFHKILREMLDQNHFPRDAIARVEQLDEEIPYGEIRPLQNENAPETEAWNEHIVRYEGKNWLEPPWFFVENYLYQRVLEATGYFEPGPQEGVDPFEPQKLRGLHASQAEARRMSQRAESWLDRPAEAREWLVELLLANVWGNQADLSMWPAGKEEQPEAHTLEKQQAFLVVNDTPVVIDHLLADSRQPFRLTYLVDNAGSELVHDLGFADLLLGTGTAANIQLQMKTQPTFVSDAMIKDLEQTIRFLTDHPDPAVRSLGERTAGHIREGRLNPAAHPFWTSPLAGWEMPPGLRKELKGSWITISKGDAHYRRLLGDRHWHPTTPFNDILRYFPTPLLALRVLKSDVAAGMKGRRYKEVQQEDPDWMTDGTWGMIQFYNGR